MLDGVGYGLRRGDLEIEQAFGDSIVCKPRDR